VHADGRVPPGRGHRTTVRSQNGVGVVAERWLRSAEPSPSLAATLGSPVAANHWVGTVGDLEATGNGLVLANLGGEAVRHRGGPLVVLHVLEEDRELVTAQAGDGVFRPEAGGEALAHPDQELVAHAVAHAVAEDNLALGHR